MSRNLTMVSAAFLFVVSIATADIAKPYKVNNAELNLVYETKPVYFNCRYPNMGLNNYFIKSFVAIRESELKVLEEAILNTQLKKFDDSLIELPLEQSHLLGLNGYFHSKANDPVEFNFIHINFK